MYLSIKRVVLIFGCVLLLATPAFGCVGKTLYIGAMDTASDRVMAELVALLINERTGTSVQIRFLPDNDALYAGLRAEDEGKRVDIIVENTVDGISVLGLERMADPDQEYLAVKKRFDKEYNITWLNPLGYTNGRPGGKPSVSAPLLRRDILTNFPLLPRILNKLSGAIDNDTYARFVAEVEGGAKPKKIAKDFLRSRKFI